MKLINGVFEIFIPGSGGYPRLERLKNQLAGKPAFELLKFCKKITNLPEFQAYAEKRDEIIKQKQEEYKSMPNMRITLSASTVPEWSELMLIENEIDIEKHQINVDFFPEWKEPDRRLSANDMEMLEAFFEFTTTPPPPSPKKKDA